MAELKNWPLALNQPGFDYPAEYFRSEHYSATSGGNGVSSPTAMKVEAQTAPDGTVRIRPGGSSVVSTYPGQGGQSYFSPEFRSKTLTVPPTGSSSGGRTDLIVRRVLDPDHEAHPEHSGEMTEEAAQDLDFQWYELIQGADASTKLSYPHVKLAEIRRPANTTIVNTSHIVDLRELADPKLTSEVITYAHGSSAPSDMGTNNGSWFTASTTHIVVPEWCNKFIIQAQAAGMYWTGGFGRGDFSINMAGLGSNENSVPFRFSGADSQGFIDTHTTAHGGFEPSGRGRPREVNFRFRNLTSSADDSRIRPTSATRFTLNVQFLQVAE